MGVDKGHPPRYCILAVLGLCLPWLNQLGDSCKNTVRSDP